MNNQKYDSNLWEQYTKDNECNNFTDSQAKFIYYFIKKLGVKRICEIGCGTGNNLKYFSPKSDIHGIDLSRFALNKAIKKHNSFTFKIGDIDNIPYTDSFFDLIFTRCVLIHIPKDNMKKSLKELLRVSNKYIFNMEYFGEDGKMIHWKRGDNLLWYRNMNEWWSKFNVEIINDVELPLEIDGGMVKLTLIKKRSLENPKCTDFIKLGDGTEICAVCKYKKNWNP